MRSTIKILDEIRDLDAHEAERFKSALSTSNSSIKTLRDLLYAVQTEEQVHREAETMMHTGNAGKAVHHYEGRMLVARSTIEHLLKTLEGELSELDLLVRDLHRLDERIGERMLAMRRAAHATQKAA